ncbi:MAG TPA: Smr/MutS family protein [Myxococcota bacterium]|nr:Smr/MutS family protein [Myxococcota bacterium]
MADDRDDSPFPDPVVIPIEDSLDLHRFLPREIENVLEGYLEAAAERGFREVRVIHGRGRGVQRARVHEVLARDPHVERFEEAPGDRGGWGATVVWLRPARMPRGEA